MLKGLSCPKGRLRDELRLRPVLLLQMSLLFLCAAFITAAKCRIAIRQHLCHGQSSEDVQNHWVAGMQGKSVGVET